MSYLWTNHYAPRTFEDILEEKGNIIYFNKHIYENIFNYFNHEGEQRYNHPHIALQGPNESGKFTIAHLILSHFFGEKIYNIKEKSILYNNKDTPTIYGSQFHYEINIQTIKPKLFLKIIQTLGESNCVYGSNIPIYILIRNLNKVGNDFITIIKETAEKYYNRIRLIITTNRELPQKIRGLFQTFRVPKPRKTAQLETISSIIDNENIDNKEHVMKNIIKSYDSYVDYSQWVNYIQGKIVNDAWCNLPSKEIITLNKVYKTLLGGGHINQIILIREYLLECLSFGKIEKLPNYLLSKLLKNKKINDDKKYKIVILFGNISERLTTQSRNYIHIEALVFNVFSILYDD
jgi:DNA polymerase III delta prime subunit